VREIDLFGEVPKEAQRKPPVLRMHVVDAADDCGYREPGQAVGVRFSCARCHSVTDWQFVTVTTAKRGIPCEKCNGGES